MQIDILVLWYTLKWLKDVVVIITWKGVINMKNKTTRITVTINDDTKNMLERLASIDGRTTTSYISYILDSYCTGIELSVYQTMEENKGVDSDLLDVFLDNMRVEYCRRLSSRINLIKMGILDIENREAECSQLPTLEKFDR